MATSTTTLDDELQRLFGAMCDGLRQEVKVRHQQAALVPDPENVSMAAEREAGVASLLAYYLREKGFFTQVEAYLLKSTSRRPDFRIWLPESKEYLYLELKPYGWGDYCSYYYATVWAGIKVDMDKLKRDGDKGELPNGMVVVGFGKNDEHRVKMPLRQAYQELPRSIISGYGEYGYECIDVQKVDLKSMDARTPYAMVGLWVRKS